jgi:hypothetical protein
MTSSRLQGARRLGIESESGSGSGVSLSVTSVTPAVLLRTAQTVRWEYVDLLNQG